MEGGSTGRSRWRVVAGVLVLSVAAVLLLWIRDQQSAGFRGGDHRADLEAGSRFSGTPGDGQTTAEPESTPVRAPTAVRIEPDSKRRASTDSVLTVLVVDQQTRFPIQEAAVRVEWLTTFDRPGSLQATLTTDSSGQASVELSPGTYGVQVSRDGYTQFGNVLPVRSDGSYRRLTFVGLPDTGATKTIAMVPVVALTGTVHNDRKQPIEGASLRFVQEGVDLRQLQLGLPAGAVVAVATTDADGGFEVGLEPGSYRVSLRRHVQQSIEEKIEVEAGMEPVSFVLVEEKGLVPLAGLVVSDGGDPLEGARISFYTNVAGEKARHLYVTKSDAEGRFTGWVLPQTPLRLNVSRTGYEAARHEQPTAAAEAEVRIVLTRYASFRVRVFDADGIEMEGGFNVAGFTLDEKPREVVRRWPEGSNLYFASSFPFRLQAEAHVLGGGRSEIVLIEEPRAEVRLDLQRGSAGLKGRVADVDGNPVDMFAMFLQCPDSLKGSVLPFFGSDGVFDLKGLHPGSCRVAIIPSRLIAVNPSLRPYSGQVELQAGATEFLEVQFDAAAAGPPR